MNKTPLSISDLHTEKFKISIKDIKFKISIREIFNIDYNISLCIYSNNGKYLLYECKK